jgi:hypothetical protein
MGYHPQMPLLSPLCPQLNLVNPPPPPCENNFWVHHWLLLLLSVVNVAVFRITEMDIPNGYRYCDELLHERVTFEVVGHELSTLYSLAEQKNSYENLNTTIVLSCALRNDTEPLSVSRSDRTVKITSQCTFVESNTDLLTSTLNM